MMKILVIKNKSLSDFESWQIWECNPSRFDWEYRDEEHCFIISGKVTVEYIENTIEIIPGDYVIFPKGLKCVWEVHEAVKKHYTFK